LTKCAQGSGIAPILSNIYLNTFDEWLSNTGLPYVRYSDDFILLGHSKDELINMIPQISIHLEEIGLHLNNQKTICCSLDTGVDFLGYHIDASGKHIPAKAEENLRERLETMWLTSGNLPFNEKLKKALEIATGWKQYYEMHHEISTIYEFVICASQLKNNPAFLSELKQHRLRLNNSCRDIMIYLSEYWRTNDSDHMELLEYEQFFNLPETISFLCSDAPFKKTASTKDVVTLTNNNFTTLSRQFSKTELTMVLDLYRCFVISDDSSLMTELMQTYTDLGLYKSASFWMNQINLKKNVKRDFVNESFTPFSRSTHNSSESTKIDYSSGTPKKLLKLCAGREDNYCSEILIPNRGRKIESQNQPLTEQIIHSHLMGTTTVGTYIQRPNGTIHFIVFDIDVSKKILLQNQNDSVVLGSYMDKAYQTALLLSKKIAEMGIHGYIEFSGYRGYRVWIFMDSWIPVRYANMFFDYMDSVLPHTDDISLEYFPNKTRVRSGKMGQVLKLPYGMHVKSGNRSYFLSDDAQPILNADAFLDAIELVPLNKIKEVLARTCNTTQKPQKTKKGNNADDISNLLESLGTLEPNIQKVLENCTLMSYLCSKAHNTGYLTHFERLSVLYVFGHLGQDGKEFVHRIMEYTLNYQYNVTEKFIRRIPERPISCVKLRDQYRTITAEKGCNCAFKRTKSCYPSPVLHAISSSSDVGEGITLPISRTLSKEKEKEVVEELNSHKNAQKIAAKILELRKQQRSIDKSIVKLENHLCKIFDSEGVDSLEIEMGLLLRRKTAQGYEWIISI